MEHHRPRVRLSAFAEQLGLKIVRDGDFFCVGKIPNPIPDRLVPIGHEKYLAEFLEYADIAAVITTAELAGQIPEHVAVGVNERPVEAAYKIHIDLCRRADHHWKSYPTEVGEGAQIHPAAIISEHDVKIGRNAKIDPGAVIRPRTIIGDNVYIGSCTVIGSEAFEAANIDGKRILLPQAGGVKIGNNVVILCNTNIVRATFGGFTEIGDDCLIDNLIHIAHDCRLGRKVTVVACAEVSGRVVLDDDSYVGPNATISNGIVVGEGATVSLGAVATRNIPAGERVSGNFAIQHKKLIRFLRSVR